MKNTFTFLFLVFSIAAYGQSNIKINILSSADYSFGKYDRSFEDQQFKDSITHHLPIGYSVNLEVEYQLDPSLSLLTGLRYSLKNMYPRVELGNYYGAMINTRPINTYLSLAYLQKHEFQIISIPVLFKKHFRTEKKISFYLLCGGSVGVQLNEIETYKTIFGFEEEFGNSKNEVEANNPELTLFNTTIEVGTGSTIRLSSDFNLIVQASAQVFDFRKSNEKAVENIGELVWWQDSFLPIGQVSLGLGLQKSF